MLVSVSLPPTEWRETTSSRLELGCALRRRATTSDWLIPSTLTPPTSNRRSPGFRVPSSMAAPVRGGEKEKVLIGDKSLKESLE